MKKSVKILGWGTLLFLLVILISSKFSKNDGKIITPFPFSFIQPQSLKEAVQARIINFDGSLGIYIYNFKTNESYKFNENKAFEAGSLYKIWVMGAVFEKIKNGDLKEDDNLEADAADINSRFGIAKEDAEITEGHLQFTISSAIEQMITISHNYAAFLLLTKVSNQDINRFLKTYGLSSSSMSQPIETTAKDIGLYFEQIYKGELVDDAYSKKMMEVLKRQKINDRIPKYLPGSIQIAHKTGDTGYFENDAGIVFTPEGDFIIVVLTKSDSPEDASEEIAQISKAVYEYFNKLPRTESPKFSLISLQEAAENLNLIYHLVPRKTVIASSIHPQSNGLGFSASDYKGR